MGLLTQKQKNRIKALAEEGAAVFEIAALTGIEALEVEAVLGHREVKSMDKTEAEQVKAEPEKRSATDAVEVKKCGRNVKLTEEKREEIRKMLRDGQTLKGAAELAGVSLSSVARIVKEMKENEPAAMGVATSSKSKYLQEYNSTISAESQALEAVKKKLLAIYETLTPEEARAWELGEVYAEVVRGLGE